MSSRVLTGLIAAAVLSCATAIGAQTPGAPASPATGDQSGSPAITVSGCVQPETSVLKRNPAAGEVGMSDEFVLTKAALKTASSSMEKPPAGAEPPAGAPPPAAEPVGTSGSASNFGKVYRVTGDKESELKTYVGQRVEITGAFKDEADAKTELSAVGTSGRAVTGELTPQNTPEITITAIKPIAGSCAGAAK
jgi:hypothetical protein